MNKDIEKAREILYNADVLLITAGAGMGVDSGLPDFRGKEGFWNAYPKAKELGLAFEEMAVPRWFSENPQLAWGFYGHRLHLYRDTIPHIGFQKLLKLSKSKKYDSFIFTSNVDGQFQKAGFDEKNIIECHGSIHYMQCINNCQDKLWDAKNISIKIDDDFQAQDPLPYCPYCKNIARSNIMMFGDHNWNGTRTNKQDKLFRLWLRNIKENNAKLAIIEMGAGMDIPTVRMLSEEIAIDFNTQLIRINPRDGFAGTVNLSMCALEALDKIIDK